MKFNLFQKVNSGYLLWTMFSYIYCIILQHTYVESFSQAVEICKILQTGLQMLINIITL